MLNISFSNVLQKSISEHYVAPSEIAQHIIKGNKANDTGLEFRTQSVFGEEIWIKLERAGLSPKVFNEAEVLEVCAGTGFLTYHLLKRCQPKKIIVNDISLTELKLAEELIVGNYPDKKINWLQGDMHNLDFNNRFNIIIGNSFLHHFHNVPKVLSRVAAMLKSGGTFISLHEPSIMATVVESRKWGIWPLAIFSIKLVNEIARHRYKGEPSPTDLWLFEASKIKMVALQAGFKKVTTIPWGLIRPIIVQQGNLNLSKSKPILTANEVKKMEHAIKADAFLNKFLPQRSFGSICLICQN
ncbi:class I SAM-dependent methyltransferase [Candidatus Levibacter sp. Uisw_134_01]|uniref:class I SAM-dependent methyltransferase n=1 Tax=Candidatus Levibacter sp. Uisw_134_01 TaxID=3230999 RepID=UPI003D581206